MSEKRNSSEAIRVAALAGELRVGLSLLLRRLREQSHAGDVTGTQKSVVLRLERDGAATVTELARAEGVRQQSMGATVASLVEAGLVRGTPDPEDGRRTILALTDACRERLRKGRAAREDWMMRAIQSNFTASEQQELARAAVLLQRLAETSGNR